MPINTALAEKVWYRYAYTRDNGHSDFILKANKCEAFFRGDQWTPGDLARLKQQKRPALTINKIISTIGNVMGEQIYNRSEISFRPKSGAPTETAEALTKVFKQISDNNQLDWVRSDMFADGIITSRGFIDIRLDFDDAMQGEVRISNLNPKNVIIDNDADQHDPDTWNEVIITKWLTADDIALYYNKEDAEYLRNKDDTYFPYGYDAIDSYRDRFGEQRNYGITTPLGNGSYSDFDMSPVMRNIRVIERQHRVMDRQDHFLDLKTGDMRPVPEGWGRDKIAAVREQYGYVVVPKLVKRIRWTVVAGNVVLHDAWSPYKHFSVVPYFPYFRRGTTVGLVENLTGPQELLNKVSSQELHVINTTANSGWKIKTGALTNMSIEELEQRGAETGLVIEVQGDPDKDVQKITPNTVPTGLDRISYKAEEHIKTISGVSDSQQGMDREDVAAKAIQAKRQAASTNLAKPLDSLVRTDFMIARNVLDLVQTFYTEERLLVITGGEGMPDESVEINKVTPEGIIANDLTVGEFAVTISSVPQRETLEDSQFEQASSMRKDLGIQIPDEFIIKSSRLLEKNRLIKQLNDAKQTPEAKQAAELTLRGQAAEVSKTEAEVAQKQADAALKGAKTQKEGITAEKEAMTPIEDGGVEAQMVKAQAEMKIAQEKHEQEMQMLREKHELELQAAQAKEQRAEKESAAKMATDRIAAITAAEKGAAPGAPAPAAKPTEGA